MNVYVKLNLALTLALVAAWFALPPANCVAQESNTDRIAPALTVAQTCEETVAPFELMTVTGEKTELVATTETHFTVVCFIGNECPLARLYAPRLKTIASEFADSSVSFIGINSNSQDSLDELKQFNETFELSFPIARDENNLVADAFTAERTPEVFVVDNQLTIRYRGRIDNQYEPGISRPEATAHYLRDALRSLVDGKDPAETQTETVGCLIGRIRPQEDTDAGVVTYCNQISRLLQSNCIECHREGQIGPFSMTDYDEVVGWADMMLEVVDEGRMPPWHADPEIGEFLNARHFAEADKQLLRDWIDAGTPYGDEIELPESLVFVDGWRLPREPDVVFEMRDRPFSVPAEGTVEYQYFVVDPGFEEDRWVMAAEVIPGNRSIVHHSVVFIRPPDGAAFTGSGWLAAYVPGQGIAPYDSTMARRIPAGSKLVFQQHYTPNGTQGDDITKIGLVFADRLQLTHELMTLIGFDQDFEIPPGADNFEVANRVPRFPRGGKLLSVSPHMHWRGKSFTFRKVDMAESANEVEPVTMLRVPAYDFNWQHDYQFAQPVPLDNVEALEFTVAFDNSEGNPVNPDPTQSVIWGDQTWEEMAVAFFNVAAPLEKVEYYVGWSVEKQAKVDQFVADFFERFDSNSDDRVSRNEVPRSIRAFRFHWYDTNEDDFLSREEVTVQAGQQIK